MPEILGSDLNALLEATPDAMVCVDRRGLIAFANAQAEQLLGYARSELVGLSVDVIVPDAARAAHPMQVAAYLEAPRTRRIGSGARLNLAARRSDGSEFPAEISLAAFGNKDAVLVAAAIRDVTDRLAADAERERLLATAERERVDTKVRQAQRLESLGQLAGGVAHDFNNLLGVILSYASLVAADIAEAAEADHDTWDSPLRDVEQIRLAAERAARLTHQLLAFARREIVHPKLLNINDVVCDMKELLDRTLGEEVELKTTLPLDLRQVMADPGQIEQVLVNLVVNARDAMPQGGVVSIETNNVDVDTVVPGTDSELAPGQYVDLRVSDAGVGMTPEVLERAFEPFFTTKSKGSGLGLATVYGAVAQAGGTVRIFSVPDVGTTFSILLPVSVESPVEVEGPSAPLAGAVVETVLIVEDEDALREATRRLLVRHGYTVMTAPDGLAAISDAAVYEGAIDLLLTDVVMPQMLGVEVARQITDQRPGVRVLFMSGYAQPVLAAQGRLAAGVTLLEKPFSDTELLAKVREVIDRND